jgi:hypothetical protein
VPTQSSVHSTGTCTPPARRRHGRTTSSCDPAATNPSSGAAGLAQFLWSTWYWAEGYCGIWGSPYDPYTAIDMMNCLLEDGQYYHWYCGGQPGCYDISIRERLVP